MHGEEQKWVDEAIQTNWVSTVGANINELERLCASKIGRKYGVALSCCTAVSHLVTRLHPNQFVLRIRQQLGVADIILKLKSDDTLHSL